MENLLQAAETRKRDQLRAKERLVQREREAEGEEYADKEQFVTTAYKKQQEEMQILEEEERLREGASFSFGIPFVSMNVVTDKCNREAAQKVTGNVELLSQHT
jgi:hypothetical protein